MKKTLPALALTFLLIVIPELFVFTTKGYAANPITFVKDTEKNVTSAATDTMSVTSTAGNTLILMLSIQAGSTSQISSVTDSAGNTWVVPSTPSQNPPANFATGANSYFAMAYSVNATAVTSVTVNISVAKNFSYNVVEFSGIASASSVNQSASSNDAAALSHTTPTITTTTANTLIIGGITVPGGTLTLNSGSSSYTALTTRATASMAGIGAYQIVSSTGPYDMTFDSTSSGAAGKGIMAFTAGASNFNPASTNFSLKSYSFGSGGDSLSSSSFKLNGTLGEVEFGRPTSTNFKFGSGLTYLLNANVPGAPTLSNPGSNYDRLKFIINTSNNASDVTYGLEISTDSTFATNVNYIKSDDTVGTTLATTDFQTYTTWGGGSGAYVTGLSSGITYYVRAKARQGSVNYTESEWGPASSGITTSTPSLTFSTSANSVTFTNLNSGNSYTDSTQTTVLTTSTNAYNGYLVNARETAALTHTVDHTTTIADYASANSSPTTWSSTGFGYTTDDNDLTGGTSTRFASGTKYAGFTTSSPGDPVADHAGPILSPISNENFTITYRVTTDSSKKAGKYTTTVLYNVVPQY